MNAKTDKLFVTDFGISDQLFESAVFFGLLLFAVAHNRFPVIHQSETFHKRFQSIIIKIIETSTSESGNELVLIQIKAFVDIVSEEDLSQMLDVTVKGSEFVERDAATVVAIENIDQLFDGALFELFVTGPYYLKRKRKREEERERGREREGLNSS